MLASPSTHGVIPCRSLVTTTNFTSVQRVHSIKTIHAANEVLKLICLPGPVTHHSPFFICGTALAAMVRLSAYSLDIHGARESLAKEQIALASEALSRLSETWAVAVPIKEEVRNVTRSVFNIESAITGPSADFGGDAQSKGETLLEDIDWQAQLGDEWLNQ